MNLALCEAQYQDFTDVALFELEVAVNATSCHISQTQLFFSRCFRYRVWTLAAAALT
jgi:hypothetical protein